MSAGWLLLLAMTPSADAQAGASADARVEPPAEPRTATPAQALPARMGFDPARSEAGFSVRMRWLQKFTGRFSRFRGEVRTLGDGRGQVELEIDATSLDMGTRARATEWALSDEFFDAANHPVIVFVSEPFPLTLATEGGELAGELSLRGVTRRVGFEMLAAECDRPGRDCPVRVDGVVKRTDFGMDAHRVAVQDKVNLDFSVHFVEADASP